MELARKIRTEAPMPSIGRMEPLAEGRRRAPRGFYINEENRINAIRGLATKLKKEPHQIGYNDFVDNGLGGLIRGYYRGSPFLAFLGAGLVTEADKGKFVNCGKWGTHSRKEERVRKVKELFEKLEKPAREINVEDFRANGLGGLIICKHYEGSAFKALLEAGLVTEEDREAMTRWGRLRGRGFGSRERRVEALKKLVAETKKNPWEVQKPDFKEHGLYSMLSCYYKCSPYRAMLDAGLVGPEHEALMRKGQASEEKRKQRRVDSVKRLLRKIRKRPEQLNQDDFINNGLSGVLGHHKGCVYRAISEAGYSVMPWNMSKTPKGFFMERENRVRATRWLVEKTRKELHGICSRDFQMNGLGGMLGEYYSSSPYAALVDAGYEINAWEMDQTPHSFFDKRENCVEAVKWLAANLEKNPDELSNRDFGSNGLSGLLGRHDGSLFKLLLATGFVKRGDELKIKKRGLRAILAAKMRAREERERAGMRR